VIVELGGSSRASFLATTDDGSRVVAVTAAPVSRSGEALTLQSHNLAAAEPAASMPLGKAGSGLAATLCGLGPGGRLVAIDVGSSALRIADIRTGRNVAFIDEAGGTRRCAFSRDERWLAVTGTGRTVRVWDLASRAEVARLDEIDQVSALALSPDGRWLATLQRGGTLAVWPLLPADLLARLCERAPVEMSRADWERFFGEQPYHPACAKSDPAPRRTAGLKPLWLVTRDVPG
jgi:hypothetical protein